MPNLAIVALPFLLIAVGFYVVIDRDLKADRALATARKEKRAHVCRPD